MSHLFRMASLLALASWAWSMPQAQSLSLYTFHSPPYHVEQRPRNDEPQVHGTTVTTMLCITGRMGWQTDIRVVPQNRAIHGLRNRLVDGYFAVDQSALLDRFASASAPIALEKWYFYSLRPLDDLHNARIAAIAGSNEAIWLEHSHHQLAMTASRPEQLLALLDRGRVDAVLMDQRVLAMQRAGHPAASMLYDEFVRFAPLSLYISHAFTQRHPDFLSLFNLHIGSCLQDNFTLDDAETRSIEETARTLLSDLRRTVEVEKVLARHSGQEDLESALELDRQWRTRAPLIASAKAAELLRTHDSAELARWQQRQNGLVTESIIMNRIGANVAISQLTSDYWQGDEAKFQSIDSTAPDTLFLSPVRFDSSSQTFQVIASMPVHEPATGAFIGGLAIGLDIEKALHGAHLHQRISD